MHVSRLWARKFSPSQAFTFCAHSSGFFNSLSHPWWWMMSLRLCKVEITAYQMKITGAASSWSKQTCGYSWNYQLSPSHCKPASSFCIIPMESVLAPFLCIIFTESGHSVCCNWVNNSTGLLWSWRHSPFNYLRCLKLCSWVQVDGILLVAI